MLRHLELDVDLHNCFAHWATAVRAKRRAPESAPEDVEAGAVNQAEPVISPEISSLAAVVQDGAARRRAQVKRQPPNSG